MRAEEPETALSCIIHILFSMSCVVRSAKPAWLVFVLGAPDSAGAALSSLLSIVFSSVLRPCLFPRGLRA